MLFLSALSACPFSFEHEFHCSWHAARHSVSRAWISSPARCAPTSKFLEALVFSLASPRYDHLLSLTMFDANNHSMSTFIFAYFHFWLYMFFFQHRYRSKSSVAIMNGLICTLQSFFFCIVNFIWSKGRSHHPYWLADERSYLGNLTTLHTSEVATFFHALIFYFLPIRFKILHRYSRILGTSFIRKSFQRIRHLFFLLALIRIQESFYDVSFQLIHL